jgi:hypothetical protein
LAHLLAHRRLSREDAWRFQYRLRPYLQNASPAELQQRLEDILRNIYAFSADGRVAAVPAAHGGSVWAQKILDINLEFDRRNMTIYDFARFDDLPFKKEALQIILANRHHAHYLQQRAVFCKYGELRWMRELISGGNVRLSPASYFRGDQHNRARKDDELTLRTVVTPYDFDLGFVPPFLQRRLPERAWVVIDHAKPSDHLLYCLTAGFDFRYFFDFGSESSVAAGCVVIHDQDKFEARLLREARRVLRGWTVRFDGVRYVDPFFVLNLLPAKENEIFFFKDFRFMYQREFRLVAVAPEGAAGTLQHVDLSLGPLGDVAELVEIAAPPLR